MAKHQSKAKSKVTKKADLKVPSFKDPAWEARISAAFARQQEEWLGPTPTRDALDQLQEQLPHALEVLAENRDTWATLAAKLANMLVLGNCDFAAKQLARYLLDSAQLRLCWSVVCNQWVTSEVSSDTRRAIEATATHASCLLTEHDYDLVAAERGLRAAAAFLRGPRAVENWEPTAHQNLVLNVLKRDGRLRAGQLWDRISPKYVGQRAHQNAMRDLVEREMVMGSGKARAIEYWLP